MIEGALFLWDFRVLETVCVCDFNFVLLLRIFCRVQIFVYFAYKPLFLINIDPATSYNWCGFQAWDTLQDSTDNSSIDKHETSLEWQEYFSQLQDTTDALPCHIHLPVCLWIMDPHSRAPKKNTSYGNEVLPQDTTHRIQRPCYHRGSPCQDTAGRWTTRRPDDRKETQTAVVWSCLPLSGPAKTILQGTVKGGRRQGRRRRVGKTTSGNGQAWSWASPRGHWRTGKNGEEWLRGHLWCPNDPRR